MSPRVRRLTAFSLSPFYIELSYFTALFIASVTYSFWSSWSGNLLQLLLPVPSLVVTALVLLVHQLVHSYLLDRSRFKPACADQRSLVPSCNSVVLNRDQNLSLYFLVNACFSILMCFSMHLRITGVLGGREQRCYLSTYATLKPAQTPAH